MTAEKLQSKKFDTPVLRGFVYFLMGFFLFTTFLTSFFLIPKINSTLENQYLEDTETGLGFEAELLERFIENHKKILQDFSDFPVITNAVLLASADNPDFVDLADSFSISGGKARLILQDIAGEGIYQTDKNLMGLYSADQGWVNAILSGDRPYHFQLLGQEKEQFTFAVSIPVKYGVSIEGILSAEITAPLQKVFSKNVTEHSAIRLKQGAVVVETEDDHVLVPSELSTKLLEPNLTLVIVNDDTAVLNAKHRLRNIVLSTLFVGLVISFLFFAFLAYRSLNDSDEEVALDKGKFSHVYLMPVLVGLIGVAATITAHIVFKNLQDQKIEQAILSNKNEQVHAIKEEIASSIEILHSLRSFYDAAGSVDRLAFSTFTNSLLQQNPEIQALEWIPKVMHGERDEYEAQARVDGLNNFNISEREQQGAMVPAANRDHYFPVYFVEPLEGNEAAIGFDLASNNKRLDVLHAARDGGRPVGTARVALLQENNDQQARVLIFNPVYESASLFNTIEERQRHLKGFVLMVLRVEDMIDSVQKENTHIYIEDITDKKESIFGTLPKVSSQGTLTSSARSKIDIAGREWELTVAPRMAAYKGQQLLVPWLVLITGLILTGFVVYSLIRLIRSRQVIEAVVKKRTQELREVRRFQDLVLSNIPDHLFVKDDAFRIVQANPAFMSAYPENKRDSIIGTTTFEDYDIDEAEKILQHDRQALEKGYVEVEEVVPCYDGNERVLLIKRVRFENTRGQPFILGIARDITDIKKIERALQQSKERYEVAVRGSAVGLWDWSIKTGSLYWSERYKEIIGIVDKDYIPKYDDFIKRIHPEDKEKTLEALFGHIKNKIPYNAEYRYQHTNGSYIWIHVRGQATWDEKGDAIRIAGTVSDVSEKKKAEEELLRSNTELERFAYVASHDLQEPLRMVASFTNLLEKRYADKLDDQAKEYIAFASNGARRMQELVLDLLEYARVGQEAERYEHIDVNKTLSLIKENLKESIDTSKTLISNDEMPVVFANPVRLMRVLQNLVGNSIKYTNSETEPNIHISAIQKDREWIFSIKDNGIGMRQEYCQKIFEPFKRLHGKDEFTGTGMGLAICRKIVEGFGGIIWAESGLGEGSTFYFTIPIKESYSEGIEQDGRPNG